MEVFSSISSLRFSEILGREDSAGGVVLESLFMGTSKLNSNCDVFRSSSVVRLVIDFEFVSLSLPLCDMERKVLSL